MRDAPLRSPASAPAVHPDWRAVAGNSGWLLLEKGVRWMLGITIGLWTARYLGPHGFGVFNATLAWVALFGAAAGLGVEPIVVRELVRRPHERSVIMATALGLRLGGGIVAATLAVLTGALWPDGSLELRLVAIGSLVTLFGVGETFDLWFQATLQARRAAFGRTAAYLASCGGRVALILTGAPVGSFLWLAAAEATLTALVLGTLFLRRTEPVRGRFSPAVARQFLRESWPNIVSNLAVIGYMRVDRLMLTGMNGGESAGVYSAAANLVEVWTIIPMALVNSTTPLLTPLHASHPARYAHELARLARLNAALAWALTIGLAGAGPFAVPLLLGADYASSVPVLIVLATSLPFAFLGLAAVPWYLNERLTRVAMMRHLLGAALNVALNLLFIPRWGAPGAAFATTIAFAVAHVLTNALTPRTRPIFHIQWRALLLLPLRSS